MCLVLIVRGCGKCGVECGLSLPRRLNSNVESHSLNMRISVLPLFVCLMVFSLVSGLAKPIFTGSRFLPKLVAFVGSSGEAVEDSTRGCLCWTTVRVFSQLWLLIYLHIKGPEKGQSRPKKGHPGP